MMDSDHDEETPLVKKSDTVDGSKSKSAPSSKGESFCGRRTGMEKCLLVVVGFLTTVGLCLVIVIGVVFSRPSNCNLTGKNSLDSSSTDENGLCTDSVCKERADVILGSMDLSINPCDDFYDYVCTNWIKKNPLPEEKSRYSIFDQVRMRVNERLKETFEDTKYRTRSQNITEKVALMYNLCVNPPKNDEEQRRPLLKIFQDIGIGQWPFTSTYQANITWIEVYRNMFQILGSYSVIAVSPVVNPKNTSEFKINFDQPSFGIGRNQLIHMHNERNAPIVQAYKKYITNSIAYFKPSLSQISVYRLAESILEFEAKLANFTRSPEERRDMETMYNKMTLGELNRKYPQMDFVSFINGLFSETGITFDDSEDIILREPEYFKRALDYLGTQSNITVLNYMGWRMSQSLGPLGVNRYREFEFQFNRVIQGVKQQVPLWQRCVSSLSNLLQHAAGRMYIDKYFSEKAKQDIDNLVSELKEAFSVLLKQNTWMDSITKINAEEKLSRMVDHIGYPPFIKNDTELERQYSLIPVLETQDFLTNVALVTHNNVFKLLKRIKSTYNRTVEWVTSAAVVNAFYNPTANSITFPAGILQSPFYTYGLPASLNYGGIGMIIGHEITHGFDDTGSQFDADGNLENWWTNETMKRFKDGAKCFVDQYGAIYSKEAEVNLNGNNSQGENIADNGGVREAFRAYKIAMAKEGPDADERKLPGLEEFTSDQMFFIATASTWCTNQRTESLIQTIQYDTHSPAKYRVNIPMSNSEDFARAFRCPKGSGMNPNKRCVLW